MGNIFSIRLTDEDKAHLQQRMNETGDEIISNIGYYASEKDLEGIKEEVHRYVLYRTQK